MRNPLHAALIPALTALTGALLTLGAATLTDHTTPPPAASRDQAEIGDVCYSTLPDEAHHTLDLIRDDGPYPYPQDGTVFNNREDLLPEHPRGYYHEYTVETPGETHRGARRIVTGNEDDDTQRHHQPDETGQKDYYTADHYRSFDRVDHTC